MCVAFTFYLSPWLRLMVVAYIHKSAFLIFLNASVTTFVDMFFHYEPDMVAVLTGTLVTLKLTLSIFGILLPST
jgi:hypothetical protein